jgi:quercetin dioxygenase-like cupin family protein
MKPTIRSSKWLRSSLVLVAVLAAIGYNARHAAGQRAAASSDGRLINETLDDLGGRQLTVTRITFPPGTNTEPHRHPSYLVAYVVSGHVESSVDDEEPVLYGPGDVWYEAHMQLHRTFRNPSATEPVTILLFRLNDPDRPLVIPEPEADRH